MSRRRISILSGADLRVIRGLSANTEVTGPKEVVYHRDSRCIREHGENTDILSKNEKGRFTRPFLSSRFSTGSMVAGGGFEPPTFGL